MLQVLEVSLLVDNFIELCRVSSHASKLTPV